MNILLILSLFTFSDSLFKSEVSIDGIFLGQYREMFNTTYGDPIQQIRTPDGWIYEFYDLTGDTSTYVLARFSSDDTLKVYSLQVNGSDYDGFIPFKGFRLGDKKSDVMLNQPPIRRLDTIPDPTGYVYFFEGVNYSFEFDQNDRLYGIGLFGYEGCGEANPVPDLNEFKRAVINADLKLLVDLVMPNCEIYPSDSSTCFILEPLGKILNNPNNCFTKLLFSKIQTSLLENIQPEMNLRIFPETMNMATVFKFDSGAIEEIVYAEHCGRNKVYEIKLR